MVERRQISAPPESFTSTAHHTMSDNDRQNAIYVLNSSCDARRMLSRMRDVVLADQRYGLHLLVCKTYLRWDKPAGLVGLNSRGVYRECLHERVRMCLDIARQTVHRWCAMEVFTMLGMGDVCYRAV